MNLRQISLVSCVVVAVAVGALRLSSKKSFTQIEGRAGDKSKSTNSIQPLATQTEASKPGPAHDAFSELTNGLAALGLKMAPSNEVVLNALALRVSIRDIPACLEGIYKLEPTPANRAIAFRLARRWAEVDPREAAIWLAHNAPGAERATALKTVLPVWAEKNAPDALAWANNLEDDYLKVASVTAVGYAVIRTDPVSALEIARTISSNQQRDDLASHALAEWTARDGKGAVDWARQIPDARVRAQMLSQALGAWATSDPMAAATAAANDLPAGKQQNDAIVSVVQQWSQTRPAQAADWILQFPEGALRTTALQSALRIWYDKDPAAAADWLSASRPAPLQDAVIAAHVDNISTLHPDVAARWAQRIEDPEQRSQRLAAIGQAWLQTDAEAARAWIATAPIPDVTKSRLLESKQVSP